MKLLEERTEASKNEMERMEALEELHELNKRNLKNELPDEMIAQYQKLNEPDEDEVEKQDEEFIKSVFGKDTNNQKIKRIIDEDENEIAPIAAKQKKVDRPTDILSNTTQEKDQKNTWDKSIGGISSKSKLEGLIIQRKLNHPIKPSSSKNSDQKESQSPGCSNVSSSVNVKSIPQTNSSNGLGSLGIDYSDTDSE